MRVSATRSWAQWNDTARRWRRGCCRNWLRLSDAGPDAVAVGCDDGELTNQELMAGEPVARPLAGRGVGPKPTSALALARM